MLDWLRKKSQAAAPPDADDIASLIQAADELRERGARDEAIAAYEAVRVRAPRRIYPHYWLATLHQEAGNLDAATRLADAGLALDPREMGLLLRAADVARQRDDWATALMHYESARRLDPSVPGIDSMIGDQLCRAARVNEGIAAFRRALAASPGDVAIQQGLLFTSNFSDTIEPEVLAQSHRQWGALHEGALASARGSRGAGGNAHPRPVIGYLSPDLRNHAVSYFVHGLFAAHRASGTEFVVFDVFPGARDEISTMLRQSATRWVDAAAMDDDAIAEAIRHHRVDILVDLAGHTNHNRLLVFARKPAPIQVSWLGYLNTTGLASMDFRLTDAWMDPPGSTEALYTETLIRLPVHACFTPREHTPAVTPFEGADPARRIRFGSVNNWAKVSPSTVEVWAAILRDCNEADLLVIVRGGQHAAVREAVQGTFAEHGVTPERVIIEPASSARRFLEMLGTVDVALDPFPYGGGTTTMHCLYMGVPVVTLAGKCAMARNSIGPLAAVGLADLVTQDRDTYRVRAIELARDRQRLAALRSTLRATMEASPLMDCASFARSFEGALTSIWQQRGSAR